MTLVKVFIEIDGAIYLHLVQRLELGVTIFGCDQKDHTCLLQSLQPHGLLRSLILAAGSCCLGASARLTRRRTTGPIWVRCPCDDSKSRFYRSLCVVLVPSDTIFVAENFKLNKKCLNIFVIKLLSNNC